MGTLDDVNPTRLSKRSQAVPLHSRAIYCSEKIPKSRIRGVRSDSQVIRRGAVLLFYSYYLWKFRSFFCFFSFIVSLLSNPNKIL